MFDLHLHTSVSYDSKELPKNMIDRARELGLKGICFTDHFDLMHGEETPYMTFTAEDFHKAYDGIKDKDLEILRGCELGLTDKESQKRFLALEKSCGFDYVIGSMHRDLTLGYGCYSKEYWEGKTALQVFDMYLENLLALLKENSNFDCLGHMTFAAKSPHNLAHERLLYKNHADVCDEIFKELINRGKGMEINTSGYSRVGEFLPSKDFLLRYKELGGEIITAGSDAHSAPKLGYMIGEATALAKDVFGYVCTFKQRKPIFHKI